MTHRAVLVNRRTEIVKRRRHDAEGARLIVHAWQIGVALQTYILHLSADQHPRIGGAMHLVASGAAFETDRRMFERERSALVAVAF